MRFKHCVAQRAYFMSIMACIVFSSLAANSPGQSALDYERAPEYQTPTINGRYRLRARSTAYTFDSVEKATVSYTHLTLPTICSV